MLSKNQIKEIQSLHAKKFRDQNKLFIIEGIKSVEELISYKPEIIESVIGTEDFISKHSKHFNKVGYATVSVSEEVLKKISLQNQPNKALAVCKYFELHNEPVDFEKKFTFYLDDIRDPGNFGTIIRLANWFGIETIYCSPSSCERYNPKVIQSSMGAFMRVNIEYIPLNELLSRTHIKNIYGALLNGNNVYKQNLKGGLVVIGNEANGITDQNLQYITNPLTIPSATNNGTESLNAAMAASVLASEFFRQLN